MGCDWIEWDKKNANKAKMRLVAQLSEEHINYTCGRMARLWSYVDDHVGPDGKLGLSVEDLVEMFGSTTAGWEALFDKKVRWLARNSAHEIIIPRWKIRFGAGAKSRSKANRRKVKQRLRDNRLGRPKSVTPKRDKVVKKTTYTGPDSTGHNRTVPDSIKTGKPVTGVFKDVSKELLADDARLLAWWRHASGQAKAVIGSSEVDRRHVFEAAERALEESGNPPALFAWIVSEKRWSYIEQSQEERAVARLKHIDRPPGESRRATPPDIDAETARSRDTEMAKLAALTDH